VEIQLALAVEMESEGVIFALTHWVSRSFQQEVVGNAGFSGEKAQTPCRKPKFIWEMWVERGFPMASRGANTNDETTNGDEVCEESSGEGNERNPIPSGIPYVNNGAKVERDHLGRRLCGAKCRGKNKRCRQPAMLNGRCKLHGGLTPLGIASPHFKHGRRSKYHWVPKLP
jgi:hypothetical protein